MTVGIVLPVLDGEAYVAEAIGSVLGGTHDDFRMVVVDDGSTDGTADVVREFEDPRITLVENDHNRGIGRSRNRGVERVSGDVLAFLDHDDVWHPEKLSRHLDVHRTTGADVVYSDLRWIDGAGTPFGVESKPDPAPAGEPLVRQLLFGGGEVITTMSSVTVRRSAWEAVDGQHEGFSVSGDVDLYVRLAGDHGFARVPEPLVDKRTHDANASDDYRSIYEDHERILSRAVERYPFLGSEDVRRKRARMAYRRGTSALLAGASGEAFDSARESLSHQRRVRPSLLAILAALDLAGGPLAPGRRLFAVYDRRTGAPPFD